LYSISLIAITAASGYKGDLYAGMVWMTQPGTYQQYLDGTPLEERSWSVVNKILVLALFSAMGFFGSSCSAAITKNFGALTMSITSTARKAMTLFLSFFLFNNVCTTEHIAGIVVFIAALTTKSLRRRNKSASKSKKKRRRVKRKESAAEAPLIVEMDIKTSETPLTFRHRTNSGDGLDNMAMHNASRSNLVHVV
jgi:UAA transporter family